MDKGFLYRRLAPVVPVCFPRIASGELRLSNKHRVASFSDVFVNPHYWRLFDMLSSPPRTVVDLGGNCGHFPVLCEIVVRSKFGPGQTQYFVFEAVEAMVKNITSTASAAQIENRVTVIHGAVGKKQGEATLMGGKRSMLDSSAVYSGPNRRIKQRVGYVDLERYLSDHSIDEIDVLKVDIEGSEYDLIDSFPELFRRVKLIFMELHDVNGKWDAVQEFFGSSGLTLMKPVIQNSPHKLIVLRNSRT
jgi:FkbM family methyltransferase